MNSLSRYTKLVLHQSEALRYHRLMTSQYSAAARKIKTKLNVNGTAALFTFSSRTPVRANEKCVADSGYEGEPDKIVMTKEEQAKDFKEFLARCKNRQETFHWRLLKAFNILGGRFRHGTRVEHRMELHRMAVDAIVGVIQYDYENGHPPFDVC